MFPPDYYKPCEKVNYGNRTFAEATHIFHKIKHGGVDEYTLLKENLADYDFKDIHLKWRTFDVNILKDYRYYMYQKKYLQWNDCQLGTDKEFTIRELL